MRKLVVLSLILLQQSLSAQYYQQYKPAQQFKMPAFDFPAKAQYATISDSIKNNSKDVIGITSSKIYYVAMAKQTETYRVTHLKLRFLTEKGISENNSFKLPPNGKYHKVDIKIRVIHPDNTVNDLALSSLTKGCGTETLETYEVPGLRVGDELEYTIQQRYEYHIVSGTYELYSKIPMMESKLRFVVNRIDPVYIIAYNQFPDPTITKVKSEYSATTAYTIYDWKATNLRAETTDNAIPSLALPHAYIDPDKLNAFLVTVDEYLYRLSDNKVPAGTYESWKVVIPKIMGHDGLKDNATKLNTLVRIHSYINDSMTFDKELNPQGANRTPEYYFNQKKLDRASRTDLYQGLFNYLGIKYDFAVVRNLSEGSLDSINFNVYMIDHMFYKFTLDSVDFQLFPRWMDETYALNEIPLSVQGAVAYAFNKPRQKTYRVLLPVMDKSFNTARTKTTINISSTSSSAAANSSGTFSGDCATDRRNTLTIQKQTSSEACFDHFCNEMFGMSGIDSVQLSFEKKNKPPFVFGVKYKYSVPYKIVNDTCLINLKDIVFNQIIKGGERTIDYNFPYTYLDDSKIYLTFDRTIDPPGTANYSTTVSNDLGSYTSALKALNGNTVMITSTYEINTLRLPKDKSAMATELEEAYQKVRAQEIKIHLQK